MLNFDLFCLSKIFEDGVLLGSADGKVFFMILFSAILCCLEVFTA